MDTYGRHRYYETPYYAAGGELFALDRVAWEIRRYARVLDYKIKTFEGTEIDILPHELAANEAAEKRPPQQFSVIGGKLESILENKDHPSRSALVWQNAFFGKSRRRGVWHPSHFVSGNSPLSLHPEVLDVTISFNYLI